MAPFLLTSPSMSLKHPAVRLPECHWKRPIWPSTRESFLQNFIENLTLPSPTTPAVPTSTCLGNIYTIKATDDCHSISKSQGIGTGWLLSDNNLQAYCSDFPKNGTLCLTNKCRVYTVKAKDTCESIATSFNITEVQFKSWNPVSWVFLILIIQVLNILGH